MNIVIPMAGLGSRFKQAGFNITKPLIQVAYQPMYRHAVDCLPLEQASKLIFIILENEFTNQLIDDISNHYSANYTINILPHITHGQAESILKSIDHLDLEKPTLIHNCDTYFSSNVDWRTIINSKDIDGAIVLFESSEPRWSYAKLNKEKTKIIDIREKEVISNFASTGTYYFHNSQQFATYLHRLIDKNLRERDEFYISTVYKLMLKANKHVIPLWANQEISCFGTPFDLVNSLNKLYSKQYL